MRLYHKTREMETERERGGRESGWKRGEKERTGEDPWMEMPLLRWAGGIWDVPTAFYGRDLEGRDALCGGSRRILGGDIGGDLGGIEGGGLDGLLLVNGASCALPREGRKKPAESREIYNGGRAEVAAERSPAKQGHRGGHCGGHCGGNQVAERQVLSLPLPLRCAVGFSFSMKCIIFGVKSIILSGITTNPSRSKLDLDGSVPAQLLPFSHSTAALVSQIHPNAPVLVKT